MHTLWSCPSLTPLWAQNSTWSFQASMLFISFKEIMEKVIEVEVDLALFTTMVWTMWYCRNVIWTSNRLFPIQCIMQEVQSIRTTFLHLVAPSPPKRVTNTCHNLKWELPPWPNLKVNFNGAIFREYNLAGVGVII